MQLTANISAVVQLYWGAKSELGQVVTRLSDVYETAKRAAMTRLQNVGMETVAISNGNINTAGSGQSIGLLFRSCHIGVLASV